MHTAQLIHITQDAEQLVAKLARVSNPSNENNKATAPRLIRYLLKHKHFSPFEMVSMCVEITTTRSIAAQILRHRSFSFQEFSQRYAEVTEDPVIPELRSQDHKNRQNSIDNLSDEQKVLYHSKIAFLYKESLDLYNKMLEDGIAKECAREVLPLSTPTRIYMHGNMRSWIHYCELRGSNGTQREHMMIAQSILQIIKEQTPMIYEAAFPNPTFLF